MNKNDYDRLSNLAALTELPGEREDFVQSLIPFYKMMDKVRNTVLENGGSAGLYSASDVSGPVLELRRDEACAFAAPESILEQSERKDGDYYSVPRSI